MSETTCPIHVTVNGQSVRCSVAPRQHLVDFLRDDLGLTGSHLGCEHGVCGACTVRLDGQVVRGCLVLAAQADGRTVETIEGLTEGRTMRDLQDAFVARNALQCGYCTSGMLMAAAELIEAKPGGVYLAWKAGVPVLPVALTGTEDAQVADRLKHFKRLEIKIVAGQPFTLPPVKGKDRDAAMQEYTDEVMCRIAALLPPDRRGVYTEHPKLKELLKS